MCRKSFLSDNKAGTEAASGPVANLAANGTIVRLNTRIRQKQKGVRKSLPSQDVVLINLGELCMISDKEKQKQKN